MSLLVVANSFGDPTPAGNLSGVGTLTADSYVTGALCNEGFLDAETTVVVIAQQPRVFVLNKTLGAAPTSVQVAVSDGLPYAAMTFAIDGAPVMTIAAGSDGCLSDLSVPVESGTPKGTHEITVTQAGANVGRDTFTLTAGPQTSAIVATADAHPVSIPSAVSGGIRRFVLQDLLPGGLGSYVLPRNPASMTSPHPERQVSAHHTTSVRDGQFHVFEGGVPPHRWTISGLLVSKEEHDMVVAYGNLRRRFYVIDHRNRAWKVVSAGASMVPRKRARYAGQPTDWLVDYELTFYVLDPEWETPS